MGTEIHVHAQNVKLQEENAVLREGIKAVRELIENSVGVAGLYVNGDVANWESLEQGGFDDEWLLAFNKAEDYLDV